MNLEELIATLTFKNNPNLRPCNANIPYTQEQLLEIARCMDDPTYFISNYIKVIHPDRGVVLMELYDYQKRMVDTYKNNRFSIAKTSRQMGKCCCINTKVRVKSKSTGMVREITLGELYEEQQRKL